MGAEPQTLDFGEDPLGSDDPEIWDRLVRAVDPAAMLVIARVRMGSFLRARTAPEDIWQETLLHAWRDRERCQWRGLRSFRRWLIQILENRIRDISEHEGALKRGGGHTITPLSGLRPAGFDSSSGLDLGPLASTTPSRMAIYRERAEAMQEALEALEAEQREVVRMRLYEERTMEEIAAELDIGLGAAKHRFRRGAEQYRRFLKHALATRSARSR